MEKENAGKMYNAINDISNLISQGRIDKYFVISDENEKGWGFGIPGRLEVEIEEKKAVIINGEHKGETSTIVVPIQRFIPGKSNDYKNEHILVIGHSEKDFLYIIENQDHKKAKEKVQELIKEYDKMDKQKINKKGFDLYFEHLKQQVYFPPVICPKLDELEKMWNKIDNSTKSQKVKIISQIMNVAKQKE